MRLDAFTRTDLLGELAGEVSAFHTGLIQNLASSGKMVPRDRIELSTPAFSGQLEYETNQHDRKKKS